ncbi:MAG: ABC transporter substrate-binding protein [Acidimicrobiia bacterium]|nr:ABC transporter substrate-binding protein [Acidimicrobiia bacterium]
MRRTALVVAFAAILAACGGSDDDATPSTAEPADATGRVFVGADGVESRIEDTSRIVTLSGDLTEAVFELGLGPSVVATDVTTIYPPEAVQLPVVGVGRFLTAEGVLRENPTLVLGDSQTSPLEAIEQIRSAGVPVVIFDVPTSFEALYAKAAAIGEVLGVPEEGQQLADRIESAIEGAVATATPLEPAPSVAFIYSRGPDVMLLFGEEMTSVPVIEAAGGKDAGTAAGVVGTVNVTPEAIVAAAPDVIVTTSEGLDALGGVDGLLAIPGFAETPAGQFGRILAYPEGDFLTFGPRIADLLATFIADLRTALSG